MSQITEKRTVITSSSSSYDDGPESYTRSYKSNIGPRSGGINRTSLSSVLSPKTGYSRSVEMSSSAGLISNPGAYGTISATGVGSVRTTRQREKKDMQDLNERFASYIEKVRFLEAQNKKLGNELEALRSKWGKETNQIKLMYETELDEARKLIDDTNKEKSRLEIRVSSLQDQLDNLQRQLDEAKRWRVQDKEIIDKLNQQMSEMESEISMLRRSNDSMDKERQRDRATIQRLNEELERLRIDLNNETLARMEADNRRQTLAEEIEFLKEVHEQELKELAALAYRDTTAENREFWKNELSQAIRDIQNEYDAKCDQIKGEMEAYYNLKVQEFRTGATKHNMEVTHAKEESKKYIKQLSDSRARLADLEARNSQLEKQYQELLREMEQKDHDHDLETSQLKEEITKLRSEMESILQELQTLMDAKLSLELEIAAYRKLLEGEETRPSSYMSSSSRKSRVSSSSMSSQSTTQSGKGEDAKPKVEDEKQSGDASQVSMKMMRGEVSAKTTYQRTSTGPVVVASVDPEGKFIVLENTSSGTSRRDVDLDRYRLERDLDSKRKLSYTFRNFSLKAGKQVKIWAKGSSTSAGLNDLVFRDADTWGTGSNITTTLINEKGEEKACHIQKTNYS
ncbi:70 kDa neurofilament protein-like isoform X1 [Haliotis rufescens]|uniref:70 kDa neurofilament protein-like isoform X1 n=1 Tax=Haliotis rufescens TaxID=6454 RepID=UPI00201FAD96|nr:70 kDa neurofilament protein-like isoform X1 [Haliotis rufescens]